MKEKPIVTSVVVGAVIFEKNKVLLLQRNINEAVYPSLWELPSGKKEPLETVGDALNREVLEETSLVVAEANPFCVFDYQIEKALEIRDAVQINYITRVVDVSKIKISEEHQNFAWVEEANLKKYEITDLTLDTIQKAFAFCSKNKKTHS